MSEADHEEWLALTTEAAVDPNQGIVDAHQHLWDRGDGAPYLLEELLRDTRSSHNVTDTVFVECSTCYRQHGPEQLRPVGETEFVATHARESDGRETRVAAIVAFADLTLGDAVEEVLEAHEQAGAGRFRGVRHRAAWDARVSRYGKERDAAALSRDDFRRGVARLGEAGYSLDVLAYHTQLSDVAAVAQSVEQTSLVIEHLGGPLGVPPYDNRQEARARWRQGMGELAGCPNVTVKLGGVGMDMLYGMGWASLSKPVGSDEVVRWWGDDIRWCIDTFGSSRCMFESNYPADRQTLGYTVIWNAFQKMARNYSTDDQDWLFGGTARRVYRIS
jgi:L-fuconolactonase